MNAKAYVSYSWSVEERTKVVDEIERLCKDRKIELVRDLHYVKYGDNIPNFETRIGRARRVFAVLSPAYFKSLHCMYELQQIFDFSNGEEKQLDRRILPVVVDRSWLDGEGKDAFLDDVGSYWKNEARAKLEGALAQLDSGAPSIGGQLTDLATFVSRIHNRLPDFVKYFADKNLTPVSKIPSDVLGDLVAGIPVVRAYEDDDSFVASLKAGIRETLAGEPVSGLVAQALEKSEFAGQDVVDALVTEPAEAIDQVLTPAYRTLRGDGASPTPQFDACWEHARGMLARVLILAVRADWLAASGLDPATDCEFDIAVQTELGVEVVSARLRQIVRVLPEHDKDRADIQGEHSISPALDEPGSWGDGTDRSETAVNVVQTAIWNKVFPESPKGEKAVLKPFELRNLDSTLRKRERSKRYHYYLRVSLADGDPELRRAVCRKVLANLPSLAVVFMGVGATGDVDVLTSDEAELLASAREFLQIPRVR